MLIIPAIDIIDNKVVRLSKGDYDKSTVYESTPLEQALTYENNEFNWIHIVDLIASKSGKINVVDIISEIKQKCKVKVEFGGGIRKLEDVDKMINAGVDKIILGSISINNKTEYEKIVNKYGDGKIITAIDVKDEFIAIKGWTEKSKVHVYEHINYCLGLGLNYFLCTDISKDGLLKGPSIELYEKLQIKFPEIKLFASGGVSSINDIKKLKKMKIYAAIVGRAIYENKINLTELAEIAE